MKDASIRVFWAQSEKQLIPSYHVQTGFHYRTFWRSYWQYSLSR